MQAENTNIAQQKNNVSYEHQQSIAKKQCKLQNNANHEQRKSTRLQWLIKAKIESKHLKHLAYLKIAKHSSYL
jgi:hypothetical protein